MLVPDLVTARPFTSAVLHDAGIITSLRVLIQHALDGAALTIDWKAFGSDVEHYLSVGELGNSSIARSAEPVVEAVVEPLGAAPIRLTCNNFE